MAASQQHSTQTHVSAEEKPCPSIQSSENTLCELCLQALILDDARAGGSIQESPDGASTALDFSGFAIDEFRSLSGPGYYSEVHRDGRCEVDQFGWHRPCVANMGCDRFVKPPDLPELSPRAAARGCQLCHRLKQLFRKEYKKKPWWQEPSSIIRFRIQYRWFGKRSKQDVPQYHLRALAVITWHPEQPDDVAEIFPFTVGALPGKCRDWLRISRYPLDDEGPLSAKNVDLINTWIKDCSANHGFCSAKCSQAGFLPTRLLDLNAGAGADTDHIALIGTAGLPLQNEHGGPMYVALSYCWGSSVPTKTTSASLASHQQGISVSNLPQVFQEAVIVARKLKIRYLWIDALCIIQDSPTDWEQESGKMSDIFAHAFITIGAATSTACDESFLRRSRAPTLRIPFRSSLDPNVSGDYTIFLDGDDPDPPNVDMNASRWNSRAWVWQEQEFSAKLLIFGKKMLQFRCLEKIHLEDGYHMPPWERLERNFGDSGYWSGVVRAFSRREITFVRDKLSAISGAAKFISRALENAGHPKQYLAGLWLDDLFCACMCWRLDHPKNSFQEMVIALTNEETYSAPSWSWASRDEGVEWSYLLRWGTPMLRVIQYHLPAASNDPMIALKPGSSITLCGKLIHIEDLAPISYDLDWNSISEYTDERAVEDNLYYLLANQFGWHTIYGILLLPFESAQGVFYRRVGIFRSVGKYLWLKECSDVELTIL